MKFYAVKSGRQTGIFKTWDECKKSVTGFSGAQFKSFPTMEEAKEYITGKTIRPLPDDGAAAYVDGSYNVKTGVYGFGAVILINGEEIEINGAGNDTEAAKMRNVAGEIEGAKRVMQWALDNNVKSLDIYYDYKGIECWCSGEWKTNKIHTAAYAEFYKQASKAVDIVFHKVKGHSGDKYNDIADALAKNAAGVEN